MYKIGGIGLKGIIDRIENNIVVLEVNQDYFNLDLNKFPKEIKEGDLVEYKDDKFIILIDETINREKKIRSLFDSLLEED